MSSFFEKVAINFRELFHDASTASSSAVNFGKASSKLIKERKKISGFKKDLQTDFHNFQLASQKPIKKIKRDQRAIEKEFDYLKKRHFFLVYKNKR